MKKMAYSVPLEAHGGIAQRLEQAAHNRLVVGSNPAAPIFSTQKTGRVSGGNPNAAGVFS